MSTAAASASLAAGSYEALHRDAVMVDRSSRLRMTFSGEKAKDALGGLLTNDIVALRAGEGQRAVALTPKGRVISVVRVFDRGTDLLVDAEEASGEGFVAMIRKFVNPRLAKFEVVSAHTACLGVYGPKAATYLSAALALDASASALEALAPFSSVAVQGGATHVVRSTDLGVPGYDVIGPTADVSALRTSLERAGLAVAAEDVLEITRVEAGVPRFGRDFGGDTIPQEANLDDLSFGAISFNKGCYTGQEVVARIHFRGHVNRHLRWLVADEHLSPGATVIDAAGKEVGDVRSSVLSPKRGAQALAIAMLRREVEPGTTVRVKNGERLIPAQCEKIA